MRAAIAIILLAACGHRDKAPAPAAARIDAAAPRAIAAATPDAEPPPDAALPDPLAGLFPKGRVAPPGPLAALSLDTPFADAKRAAPALFTENGVTDPRWPGVTFRADVITESGRVIGYQGTAVEFAAGAITRDGLERAWGPGVDATGDFHYAVVVWFDPEAGVRAIFDEGHGRIEFRHYLPLAKLLGDGPDVAVGPTPDALVAAHPNRRHDKGPSAALPPTDWDFSDGFMTVQSTGHIPGHTTFYLLYIYYEARPAARDEIKAAFEKKWGKGVARGDDLVFRDGPIEITAHDDKGSDWTLEVKDRALVARMQRRP